METGQEGGCRLNSNVWPPSKFPFRDEDTSGIPMQCDMDEYINQLLAEMPKPTQNNSLDEPIPETVKRRLFKPLYPGKYRPPRPPPTWKDRKRKAILEELDPLPPQKAVPTIQDYQQEILEVFEQ